MMLRSAVATFAGLVCLASGAQGSLVFDASLGTLPTAQGWSFDGSYNAPMSVSGGQLTMGPTTVNGTTLWNHDLVEPLDFTTQTAHIEATVRLTGAGFGNISGFRRGGFSLYIQDSVGSWIIADVGDGRISMRNDNNGTSDPVMAFDMTDAFHTLRLEAGPSGARLLVDGSQMLTLGMGGGAGGSAGGWWGEGTILAAASQIEVRRAEIVPAPGAIALMGLGGLAATRRRR
jgi:hypothetical protein